MTLLKESIKAALENRPVRENLGDEISLHVNKIVFTSLFDLGTAGEGFLYHAGSRLGSTLVEMGEVRGESVEAVLNRLIEICNMLKLGTLKLAEVDEDSGDNALRLLLLQWHARDRARRLFLRGRDLFGSPPKGIKPRVQSGRNEVSLLGRQGVPIRDQRELKWQTQ